MKMKVKDFLAKLEEFPDKIKISFRKNTKIYNFDISKVEVFYDWSDDTVDGRIEVIGDSVLFDVLVYDFDICEYSRKDRYCTLEEEALFSLSFVEKTKIIE